MMESVDNNNKEFLPPNVFEYTSAMQFLLDSIEFKKRKNSHFSVRQLAKKMGLSSHTLLSLLISGKRPLRLKHSNFLSEGLGLSDHQKVYFQTLIQYEGATTVEEKDLFKLRLLDQSPRKEFTTKELDEFSVISDWVHMAILAASRLKWFDGKSETLAKRLGAKTSVQEVRSAINRMVGMGLLKKHERDGILWPSFQRITNKDEIANAGVRRYHQQVIHLAKNAVVEQTIEEREFQSLSIAIREQDLEPAKEMIKKFRTDFVQKFGLQERLADELYQMNIQFFKLSQELCEEESSSLEVVES